MASRLTIPIPRNSIAVGVALMALLSFGNVHGSEANEATRKVLEANPDTMSAVMLLRGNAAPLCTIGKIIDGQMVVDNARTAVLYAPEFRGWHKRGELTKYSEVHPDVEGLRDAMQNGRCTIAVETARNIADLSRELERDGMIFRMMPAPLNQDQLADAYAISLGFTNNAELLLAASMLANKEELMAYYQFGVTTKAAYDEAVERMRADGYSDDPAQLLSFLKDEAEGARRNLSARTIRDERNTSGSSQSQGAASN